MRCHFTPVRINSVSSVAQLCLILCNPMNHSTPGLPVCHQLLESTQIHVHWVGDTIQPSQPLLSPSPPAFNLSQYQGLFKWVSSLHQEAKVLEFQLQHQSFQWTPRTVLLCSVQVSCLVMFDSLQPHGLQYTSPPCPSPTPRACSNSCPLSRWCHQTILSSVVCFSSCLQSFPVSRSFQMSQVFASGSLNIGASASASVLPMNIQDWFALELTGWISLLSKGLSRVFSNTTVQKHQVFGVQLSL